MLLRATSHIAIREVAGLGMAGRLMPSSLMLLVAMRRLDRRNDLGAVVVETLIDGEEVEDAVVDAGGEDDIVDDGRGKRVTGRAEKLVGFGTGEPQRERELDRRSLRDGTVRVRDDGGPRAAVDPGRVVRKGRVAMALALDMACEQVGESSLAGDGCWRSGGVHCRTSF